MGSELVFRRIHAWHDAGLIDDLTAARLADAESAEPVTEEATRGIAASGAAVPREAPITVSELFAYLGGAFLLAAWYAFAASTAPDDSTGWYGVAALIAALALAAAGLVLRRRPDRRARRGAGVALLIALPNLGVAVNNILESASGSRFDDGSLIPLVAALVVVGAAFGARRLLPALSTQLGLALACVAAGVFGLSWVESMLFPAYGYEGRPEATEELVKAVGTIAWWLVVAAAMSVLLIRLDSGDGVEGRRRLGRLAVGLTAVGGTALGALAYGYYGEPVIEPYLGAGILAILGFALVALANRLGAVDYVWSGGLAIFGALTYLNAQYLAVETGLWIALLAEGLLLLAVGFGTRLVAARIGVSGSRSPGS
jgi:hypothetical protein